LPRPPLKMPRLLRRCPWSLSLSEEDGEAEEEAEEDEEDDDERVRPSAFPAASVSSKFSPLSARAPSPVSLSCVSSHLASSLLARDGPKSREARRPAGGGLRGVGAFASAGADRARGFGFLVLGLRGPGKCVFGWACAGVIVSQLPSSPSKSTP
jgi:hypothetical protein